MKKNYEQIILSDGQEANLMPTKSTYQNILIVELDGVLRVIDKETKELAQSIGATHNKHAYYVRSSSSQ
jgi:ABC-type lipoprotein export system ATPase subunit